MKSRNSLVSVLPERQVKVSWYAAAAAFVDSLLAGDDSLSGGLRHLQVAVRGTPLSALNGPRGAFRRPTATQLSPSTGSTASIRPAEPSTSWNQMQTSKAGVSSAVSRAPLLRLVGASLRLGCESEDAAKSASTIATQLVSKVFDAQQGVGPKVSSDDLEADWSALFEEYFGPSELANGGGYKAFAFHEHGASAAASLMRHQTRQGRWHEACSFFSSTYVKNTATATAYVNALLAGNRWTAALDALRAMPPETRGDVELSALLRQAAAAGESGQGPSWSDALEVYAETLPMSGNGSLPALGPFHSALRTLGVKNRWVDAAALVEHLIPEADEAAAAALAADREGASSGLVSSTGEIPTVNTVSRICYALRSQWHLALHYTSVVMSRHALTKQLDRVALTQMAVVCLNSARWAEATRVCSLADNNRVDLEPSVYCRVLVACNKHGRRPDLAVKLLGRVQASRNDRLIRHAMNSMVHHCHSYLAAKGWVEAMQQRELSLDHQSYERLVELAARAGEWQNALVHLRTTSALAVESQSGGEQKQEGEEPSWRIPSTKSHDFVQFALLDAGVNWQVGLQLFADMEQLGVVGGSNIAFRSVTTALMNAKRADLAQALLMQSMKRGLGSQ